MQIQCPGCKARFIIPEDKLPQKDTFQALCPRCHNRFTISLKKEEEGRETIIEEALFNQDMVEDIYSDLPQALVCEDNPSQRNLIIEALQTLSYKPIVVNNPEEAMEKTKSAFYGLIVMNEEFGGSTENNCLLSHLQHMSMSNRRNIFLALIGKNFKTMDNFMAFARSANLVINPKDLSNLKHILKRAIDNNNRFYRLFKDCLQELGKL
jgi:predicted Zn finger-like uncharacterized protein